MASVKDLYISTYNQQIYLFKMRTNICRRIGRIMKFYNFFIKFKGRCYYNLYHLRRQASVSIPFSDCRYMGEATWYTYYICHANERLCFRYVPFLVSSWSEGEAHSRTRRAIRSVVIREKKLFVLARDPARLSPHTATQFDSATLRSGWHGREIAF